MNWLFLGLRYESVSGTPQGTTPQGYLPFASVYSCKGDAIRHTLSAVVQYCLCFSWNTTCSYSPKYFSFFICPCVLLSEHTICLAAPHLHGILIVAGCSRHVAIGTQAGGDKRESKCLVSRCPRPVTFICQQPSLLIPNNLLWRCGRVRRRGE